MFLVQTAQRFRYDPYARAAPTVAVVPTALASVLPSSLPNVAVGDAESTASSHCPTPSSRSTTPRTCTVDDADGAADEFDDWSLVPANASAIPLPPPPYHAFLQQGHCDPATQRRIHSRALQELCGIDYFTQSAMFFPYPQSCAAAINGGRPPAPVPPPHPRPRPSSVGGADVTFLVKNVSTNQAACFACMQCDHCTCPGDGPQLLDEFSFLDCVVSRLGSQYQFPRVIDVQCQYQGSFKLGTLYMTVRFAEVDGMTLLRFTTALSRRILMDRWGYWWDDSQRVFERLHWHYRHGMSQDMRHHLTEGLPIAALSVEVPATRSLNERLGNPMWLLRRSVL